MDYICTGGDGQKVTVTKLCETIFIGRSSRICFFGVEERREEKIASVYARVHEQ